MSELVERLRNVGVLTTNDTHQWIERDKHFTLCREAAAEIVRQAARIEAMGIVNARMLFGLETMRGWIEDDRLDHAAALKLIETSLPISPPAPDPKQMTMAERYQQGLVKFRTTLDPAAAGRVLDAIVEDTDDAD